jgi:argininosuccinate lyase
MPAGGPQLGADELAALGVDASVAARGHVGGTSPAQVRVQVARWRERLARR